MIKLVECNTSAGYQGIKDKNDNNLYFVKETRQLFKGLYEYCPYPSVYSGDSTPGLVPAPSSGASDRYLRSDGQWGVPTNTTYGVFTTGKTGLVPAPSSADAGKFLRGDGTWQEASGGSSQYVLPQATGAALGGIKVGYDPQGSTDYAVQLDSSGNAYVNISLKVVTKSNDGLMTSEMLEKLNSLSTDDGSID